MLQSKVRINVLHISCAIPKNTCVNSKKYLEPMKLIGEGVYNLNDMKVIEVTDSFLSMDQEDRKCQSNEPLLNCTAKNYMKELIKQCRCLPFNIRLSDKVVLSYLFVIFIKI